MKTQEIKSVKEVNYTKNKHYYLFILLIVSFLFTIFITFKSFSLMSGIRAYISGESLYSKATNQAYQHFISYLYSKKNEDYILFKEELKIPLADRVARIELEKSQMNIATTADALLSGGNDASDIDNMIDMFRNFGNFPYVKDAITAWKNADDSIQKLVEFSQIINKQMEVNPNTINYQKEYNRLIEIKSVIEDSEKVFISKLVRVSNILKSISTILVILAFCVTFGIITYLFLYDKMIIDDIRKFTIKLEEQNQKKSAESTLSNLLRGDNNLDNLCFQVISHIAKTVGAEVGTIYVSEEDSKDSKDSKLRLLGSYSYTRRKNLLSSIELGQGLVGEAARGKQMIAISEVPENYIRIESSLGNATPRSLLALPLIYKEKVCGVIELASLKTFSDENIDFLNLVSEKIAIAINVTQTNDHTLKLLKRTQEQSEELKAQQEELRVTNEELEERTNLLEIQKSEMVKKNTELKKSKIDLEEKSYQLELSTKYKSEFLSNISHELRTPLNSLMILSKKLLKNKENNLTTKQVEDISIIHSSGNDLLELINNILDLSKIEAGKMNISPEIISYSELTKKIKNMFIALFEEKNIKFSINVDSTLPGTFFTDLQKIEQVIKNLVANALKFTTAGEVALMFFRIDNSQIQSNILKIPEFTCTDIDKEGMIAIRVTDTGIGIPLERQKDIFEAFQQADGSTSRKYGGTGLGLTITRELVTLLGGIIHLESTPGKGATFTVIIPDNYSKTSKTLLLNSYENNLVSNNVSNSPASSDMIKKSSKSSIPLNSIQDDLEKIQVEDRPILIIEDDLKFAQTLYSFCKDKGYKCLHAGDGERGLELAKMYPISAIILDLKLPGQNGISVLKTLKHDLKTRHIPVHIMSAYTNSYDFYETIKGLGAVGIINKPVTLDLLEDAFEKISSFSEKAIKKLLVIEDNSITCEEVKSILESTTIKIDTANTAAIALERIKSDKYDCVLLDLILPDMNGFELLEQFDHLDKNQIPPVIVYTAKSLSDEELFRLNKYASSIISKGPSSNERLLDETALFLHAKIEQLPKQVRKKINDLHNITANKKKILLVDDDVRNIYSIISLLEDFDLEIFKAGNGQMAIDVLNLNPDINLVLMDIMMPVMDGYEAITKIRMDYRFFKLPILALTAKAMEEDRKKCYEVGATDYLTKPINEEKLISAIRVWLS
ncbi:MAG: response regulator [Oligoflexia bacterium]|nr:response regulator [Oligoflexia bacterium]